MRKIDEATVRRILDAADIVEVVSDFVSLKRRGANYIGLCPFHNERTPSFSVSKSKGICKCFSCGKGGSAVGFIMEHEQMTYNEALRYLAKKYHIEIKDHEMTAEEMQAETEREAMLAVNDFAMQHFAHNLTDTEDGRAIGLSYFRERGINDLMIQRFHLGYAMDKFDDLCTAAKKRGYNEKYLIDTGLCATSQRGTVYDKFKGRVIYPLFSVSGRVIAFGGRILTSDKSSAKYINSPQSEIYNKSRELYGLYQAKKAIKDAKKCILVEGYMDVISMHQAGIENVVASSGTSLTEGQIRLIHRFTDNVTLIYDADGAGIKASLRGIDMLLAEGMNVNVLLLPEGDDPDSYAQHHTSAEVMAYIEQNETDFIRFKTRILLSDAQNDPRKRADAISQIIASIALIPDTILRAEYVKECSRMLEISEDILMLQLKKVIADNLEKKRAGAAQGAPTPNGASDPHSTGNPAPAPSQAQEVQPAVAAPQTVTVSSSGAKAQAKMEQYEQAIIKYIVRYGLSTLWTEGDDSVSVLQYIIDELATDGITLTTPIYQRMLDIVIDIANNRWSHDKKAMEDTLAQQFQKSMAEGREKIRLEAEDLADIEARERRLTEECSQAYAEAMDQYATQYLESILISSDDDSVRNTATNLVYEKYTLSKVHTRFTHVESERERLEDLVPRAVVELKLGIVNDQIAHLQAQIKTHAQDTSVIELLTQQHNLYAIRAEFSKFLGERIVTPK